MSISSGLKGLTLMLLVANCQYKVIQKTCTMTETLAHGWSTGSTLRELSNEYQHDRIYRKVSEISAALGNSATIINSQNNYWGNSPIPDSSKDTFHQKSATKEISLIYQKTFRFLKFAIDFTS